MRELDNVRSESYEDKVENAFVDFILKEGFSTEEITTAYYQLLGVSESEASTDKQIELLSKMQSMVKDKYPLNRFARLIEKLGQIDHSVEDYESFVGGLAISDREKDVLISIIEERRTGELEFYLGDKLVVGIKIVENGSAQITAFKILEHLPSLLKKLSSDEGDLSVQFSEE